MKDQIVLSLFPGADLFGRAFEEEGFCVLRGPDLLWGGDVRDFHLPPDRIDGIIGGPPCQPFSTAALGGSDKKDLIPEFLRLVKEARPRWAVMENVMGARHSDHFPDWPYTIIRDFDCGGLTYRRRLFAVYGLPPVPVPPARNGDPRYSVLASSWNSRTGKSPFKGHKRLEPAEAATLQAFPNLSDVIMKNQPRGVSATARHVLAVHMLGNGVPRAMGLYVARHVRRILEGDDSWYLTDLPLFEDATAD